jgi:hypothetical protein
VPRLENVEKVLTGHLVIRHLMIQLLAYQLLLLVRPNCSYKQPGHNPAPCPAGVESSPGR